MHAGEHGGRRVAVRAQPQVGRLDDRTRPGGCPRPRCDLRQVVAGGQAQLRHAGVLRADEPDRQVPGGEVALQGAQVLRLDRVLVHDVEPVLATRVHGHRPGRVSPDAILVQPVDDLLGQRTERGALLQDRAAHGAGRALRRVLPADPVEQCAGADAHRDQPQRLDEPHRGQPGEQDQHDERRELAVPGPHLRQILRGGTVARGAGRRRDHGRGEVDLGDPLPPGPPRHRDPTPDRTELGTQQAVRVGGGPRRAAPEIPTHPLRDRGRMALRRQDPALGHRPEAPGQRGSVLVVLFVRGGGGLDRRHVLEQRHDGGLDLDAVLDELGVDRVVVDLRR